MILGYVRVSTTEQAADNRSSLQEQERKIKGVALIRGADPYDTVIFRDPGVSGSLPLSLRPAGAEMLGAMQAGDIIISSKLDRLFRSASDALVTVEDLQKKQVGVIFADIGSDPVTENGVSKLFFSMLAAFAEFERTRIAERMEDGRRHKRARQGHMGGHAPYGFRVEGEGRDAQLVEFEREQEIIGLVRRMHRQEYIPSRIGKFLDSRGYRTRSGEPWQVVQILRIMETQNAHQG